METCAYFPGLVLSRLQCLAMTGPTKKDGFLLGENSMKVTDKMSDTSATDVTVQQEIVVQRFVTNERTFSYYDQIGNIEERKIPENIKHGAESLLGVFFVRNNTLNRLAIREKKLVRSLLKSKHFHHKTILVMLLNPSCENKSTLSFPYKSFTCTADGDIESVQSSILNLGSAPSHEYSKTSKLLGTQSQPSSQSLNELQNFFRSRVFTETGSVQLSDDSFSFIHKSLQILQHLQTKLKHLQDEVARKRGEST